MSRDWQKDMGLAHKARYEFMSMQPRHLNELIDALFHWLGQHAENSNEACFWKGEYAAEKERADKAEEREKVLKHAFIVMLGYVPKTARVALDFDEVLASLYPEEGTK